MSNGGTSGQDMQQSLSGSVQWADQLNHLRQEPKVIRGPLRHGLRTMAALK